MKTSPADIDLIERFLKGQLTHDEAVDFETRLGEDHEFARILRLRKTFPSLFKAEGHDEIAMRLDDTPKVRTKKRKSRRVKPWHILLGLFIILAAGTFYFFLFIRTSRPDLNTVDQKPVTQTVKKVEPQLSLPVKTAEPMKTTVETEKLVQKSELPEKTTASKPEITKAPGITVHKPIELQSPADNMVVKRGDTILFTWKQANDSFTNFYIISEANNKLAWWRGIRPGVRELKVSAFNFKSGRFYWYVGSREYKRTLIVSQ